MCLVLSFSKLILYFYKVHFSSSVSSTIFCKDPKKRHFFQEVTVRTEL